MFVLSIYIRMCIESFQILLLTSISEAIEFNIYSTSASLSFSIAILQIVLCFLILIAIFILWIKLRKDSSSEKFQIPNMNRFNDSIEELYKDINEKFTAKGFMLLSNLRVFSLSVCVMCIKKDQIYEIVCIQAIYLFLVVLIRPFDKVHLNIIAIQNEIFLLILSSLLIFLNTESKWKNSFGMLGSTFGKINGMKASESLYICLLTLNTFITMIIIIIITISNIISRCICKRNMRISDEHIETSIEHPKALNKICKCFRKSQKSLIKPAQSQISMMKLEETKSTPSLEQVRKALASVKRKRLYNVANENSINITLPSSKRLDLPS